MQNSHKYSLVSKPSMNSHVILLQKISLKLLAIKYYYNYAVTVTIKINYKEYLRFKYAKSVKFIQGRSIARYNNPYRQNCIFLLSKKT